MKMWIRTKKAQTKRSDLSQEYEPQIDADKRRCLIQLEAALRKSALICGLVLE